MGQKGDLSRKEDEFGTTKALIPILKITYVYFVLVIRFAFAKVHAIHFMELVLTSEMRR
jgi:hypothetical protein